MGGHRVIGKGGGRGAAQAIQGLTGGLVQRVGGLRGLAIGIVGQLGGLPGCPFHAGHSVQGVDGAGGK